MKPPCLIVIYYVLPAIRAIIVQKLIEEYNLREIDVAIRTGITPAAITQYMKGKRGSSLVRAITQSERAMKIISDITECLGKKETSIDIILNKLCEVCHIIRSEGLICDIHQVELQTLKECKCDFCKKNLSL